MANARDILEQARAAVDPTEAQALLRAARDRAVREGDRRTEAKALVELGGRAVQSSDPDEALPLLERARGLLRELDDPASLGVCRWYALQLREIGDETIDPAEREGELRSVLALCERGDEPAFAGAACCELAREADPLEADRLWARAAAHFERAALPLRRLRALRGWAEQRAARGETERAASLLDAALESVRAIGPSRAARRLEAELEETRGDVAGASGRSEEAAGAWREALCLWGWLEVSRAVERVGAKLRDRKGATPHPLFEAECATCAGVGHFTGRFAEADTNGRSCGLFYCPSCRQTYRVWKRGLEEAWGARRRETQRGSSPVPHR